MVLLLPFLQRILQELQNVSMLSSFMMIFILVPSALTLIMYNRVRNDVERHEYKSPPSPPKLPFIGNLHQLGTLPHRSLQALTRKYGPIMLMHLGSTPTLVVSSAELVEEMIKSQDVVFSNRPKKTAAKILLHGSQDIVFGNYDEKWRQARKICALHLLSLHRVQSFQYVREEEVDRMIGKIRHLCSGEPINIAEMMASGSNNIISRCVLGGHKETNGENELSRFVKVLIKLFGSFCYGDCFPWLGWLDVLTGVVPSMKQTSKEWDSCIDQVTEERKMSKTSDRRQDIVDILLQLQSEDSRYAITQDMLRTIVMDMIVAGSETSSTAMEWIMAELMRNPTTMKKAQEEARRIVGKKTKIERSDIDQMEYLKCVIKETLRLHSPVPLLVPRETSSDVKLGGYDIRARTQVLVNAWAIHRDPTKWGDNAEQFVPERFENNPIDFKGQDFDFIPFGAGRRGCPGISFGVASIEYSLANLLYWFDWALPQGLGAEDVDMGEVYSLTATMKVPLGVVPTEYSP